MAGTSTDGVPGAGSATLPHGETRTLVDHYLAEQQRLQTPVRRFSDAHDRGAMRGAEPWRDLIPLSRPSPGEQYAFEVDLDRCTGCKACVAGCHSLNGLDETETWRDVGLIVGGTRSRPYQQTVTTACHHCADPACLNGCPVLAYEKDPVTGIVRHLDDQCIGCQYCVLKCPYDVPKYSERLGIVRKCDLCHGRLSAGEAPACVQACPTQAIRIVTVRTHAANGTAEPDDAFFLPLAPAPEVTHPTTRYLTRRPLPANAAAADAAALRLQPAHWPLVVMLTLVPLAVGSLIVDVAALPGRGLAIVSAAAAAAGLAASVAHLGQPLRAWRVFLGLRRSWLSREAVVFGLWFPLVALYALWPFAPARLLGPLFAARGPLGWAVVVIGLTGLACSVMIYADTRRTHWRLPQTFVRFFGTAGLLGIAASFALAPATWSAAAAAGLALVKLAVELRDLRVLDVEEEHDDAPSPERKTALVLTTVLRPVFSLRLIAALAVGATAAAYVAGLPPAPLRWLLPLSAVAGELAERYLFFRAVTAPKMPGVQTA